MGIEPIRSAWMADDLPIGQYDCMYAFAEGTNQSVVQEEGDTPPTSGCPVLFKLSYSCIKIDKLKVQVGYLIHPHG